MMNIASQVINKARRLIYKSWGAKLGYGCRVTPEEWNKQYAEGQWDKLSTLGEKDHYELIVSYCLEGTEKKKILDLGCGNGVLLGYFQSDHRSNFEYNGVDLSAQAISMAKKHYSDGVFEVNDIESYIPDSSYDVIVFNESLYYTRRPLKLLKRLEGNLKAAGTFVISMCEYKDHDVIWKILDSNYNCLSIHNVTNNKNQSWRVSEFSVKSQI